MIWYIVIWYVEDMLELCYVTFMIYDMVWYVHDVNWYVQIYDKLWYSLCATWMIYDMIDMQNDELA